MAFTKRASSGKAKRIYPHNPPNTRKTKQQKHDNGPTQIMLKVTLHFGWRQTQTDPLRPICPKQKWFRCQGCFFLVFSPAATLTVKPTKLVHWPDVSYKSHVAVALCWPPTHWADVSMPCSLHQALLHPQVLSCIPLPVKSTCVPSSSQESVVNQKALNPWNHIWYTLVIPTQTSEQGTTKTVQSDLPVNNVSSWWDSWLSIRTSLNFNESHQLCI